MLRTSHEIQIPSLRKRGHAYVRNRKSRRKPFVFTARRGTSRFRYLRNVVNAAASFHRKEIKREERQARASMQIRNVIAFRESSRSRR